MSSGRQFWIDRLLEMGLPVLTAAARRELRRIMPMETTREDCTCVYLEAVGRLLAGMAPYLETSGDEKLGLLARKSIAAVSDPASPDYVYPPEGEPLNPQLLVDAAFLSHALLRAPVTLFGKLAPEEQSGLLVFLERSLTIVPAANNWLLFSATVEAALCRFGNRKQRSWLRLAAACHDQWFKGDGIYGDGHNFSQDYYNSFVIHPMLLECVREAGDPRFEKFLKRSRRYAEIQERMIAPDGSYPATGRSITYRCGAFQLLSQIALWKELPPSLSEGGVRSALRTVVERTLTAPGTYDEAGFLRIGLCGYQPSLGEGYISTGSLYLASQAFLVLGLPAEDSFWTVSGEPWSARKLWSGVNLPADHATQD